MKDYLKYKAIETHFDGYHFRSRLEARWATFFKVLNIPYEYEKEGYDLNGVHYLPDFWLPELKHWVEIKGQAPTEEEMHKARELALFTQKDVIVISGNIAPADEPYMQDIRLEHTPTLFASYYEGVTRIYHRQISAPPEVLSILQSLDEINLKATVDSGCLVIEPTRLSCYGSYHMPEFAEKLQKQAAMFPLLIPLLTRYEEEIIDTLTIEPEGDEDGEEWDIYFNQGVSLNDLEWSECTGCHKVDLVASGFPHTDCTQTPHGDWMNDTPRIKAAYTAARQARFERFEKKDGSEAKS